MRDDESGDGDDFVRAAVLAQAQRKFLLPANHPGVLAWEGLVMCLVLWVTLYVPFLLAFDPPYANSAGFLALSMVIDVLFAIDILMRFNIAFMVDDRMVLDRRAIAYKYLTGWFCLDFVSCTWRGRCY